MIADPDGILERAAGPYRRRRFYPPNCHPATQRMRDQLFVLERLREEYPPGLDTKLADESIETIRAELRKFEIGEDIAKAEHVLRHYGGIGR